MEKLTYSVEEAAAATGIGRNKAYELANSGAWPVVRWGSRILIPKAALEKMLAEAGQKTGAGAA